MWNARTWAFVLLAACSSKSHDQAKNGDSPSGSAAQTVKTPGASDELGVATFELGEGTPEARAHFTRGLLALHSFWYDEAIKEFDAAIAADPSMRMAYWGASISRCQLLWGADDIAAAREILTRMPDPRQLSPRGQAWVAALVNLLSKGDVRASRKKFLATMEQVHAAFPDDESATFLAVALLSATQPEDPDTLAVRKRAASLAVGVLAHNPKHPGAIHYLIHAYDTPELASLGLPYAREYAKTGPAAFHARHMPAHIFSRLGLWKESVASCQDAWDVSVKAAQRDKLSADHHDFHSLGWIVELSFERGRRKDADAAMATYATTVRGGVSNKQRSFFAIAVASYMARSGEWGRAEELLAPLQAAAQQAAPKTPGRADAGSSHCAGTQTEPDDALIEEMFALDARARAASAQHDVKGTDAWIAKMHAVQDKMRTFLTATQPKEVVDKIMQSHTRHHEVLRARASGNDAKLLELLRQSVAESDREVGGESNPSGNNVREEIADVLLRMGRAKDAAAEYALVLEKHPHRAHSTLGAARALMKASDVDGARKRYSELVDIWADADPDTDGLAEARAAVAGK